MSLATSLIPRLACRAQPCPTTPRPAGPHLAKPRHNPACRASPCHAKPHHALAHHAATHPHLNSSQHTRPRPNTSDPIAPSLTAPCRITAHLGSPSHAMPCPTTPRLTMSANHAAPCHAAPSPSPPSRTGTCHDSPRQTSRLSKRTTLNRPYVGRMSAIPTTRPASVSTSRKSIEPTYSGKLTAKSKLAVQPALNAGRRRVIPARCTVTRRASM